MKFYSFSVVFANCCDDSNILHFVSHIFGCSENIKNILVLYKLNTSNMTHMVNKKNKFIVLYLSVQHLFFFFSSEQKHAF